MKMIDGGVTSAKGFQAAGIAAGIKKGNTKDMAMIYSEKPCNTAGTFTTNVVKAAPVKWDQKVVYESLIPRLLCATAVLQMHAQEKRDMATARQQRRQQGKS